MDGQFSVFTYFICINSYPHIELRDNNTTNKMPNSTYKLIIYLTPEAARRGRRMEEQEDTIVKYYNTCKQAWKALTLYKTRRRGVKIGVVACEIRHRCEEQHGWVKGGLWAWVDSEE